LQIENYIAIININKKHQKVLIFVSFSIHIYEITDKITNHYLKSNDNGNELFLKNNFSNPVYKYTINIHNINISIISSSPGDSRPS